MASFWACDSQALTKMVGAFAVLHLFPFINSCDKHIIDVISKAGFTVNKKKTRLLYRDSRQEVTGLVVNKKISVNRTYSRKTKAMAHQLYTMGEFTIDGIPSNIKQLEGRFSFIDQSPSQKLCKPP